MSLTRNRFARQFILWLAICCISAAPGFLCGLMAYEERIGTHNMITALAMGTVILSFTLLYTFICCSDTYFRIKHNGRLYGAFRIGFYLRLYYSVILFIPLFIGWVLDVDVIAIFALLMGEGLIGGLAIFLIEEMAGWTSALPSYWSLFVTVVLTTMMHAFFLNVIILFLVWLIYMFRWKQPTYNHL